MRPYMDEISPRFVPIYTWPGNRGGMFLGTYIRARKSVSMKYTSGVRLEPVPSILDDARCEGVTYTELPGVYDRSITQPRIFLACGMRCITTPRLSGNFSETCNEEKIQSSACMTLTRCFGSWVAPSTLLRQSTRYPVEQW